jgi:hypothetical protein
MVKVKIFIFEEINVCIAYFYDILSKEHNILHTNIKFEDESTLYVSMNFFYRESNDYSFKIFSLISKQRSTHLPVCLV